MVVAFDGSDAACGLAIACRLDRNRWPRQAQGAYLLWQRHLELTQAEAAYRTGKRT